MNDGVYLPRLRHANDWLLAGVRAQLAAEWRAEFEPDRRYLEWRAPDVADDELIELFEPDADADEVLGIPVRVLPYDVVEMLEQARLKLTAWQQIVLKGVWSGEPVLISHPRRAGRSTFHSRLLKDNPHAQVREVVREHTDELLRLGVRP